MKYKTVKTLSWHLQISHNSVYHLQQALPRVLFRTQVVERKWKLRVRFSPSEGEPRASNEDFDDDWQRRFLACGVQVKITAKNSRYWMFSLLRLCFVLYGEIYDKNE